MVHKYTVRYLTKQRLRIRNGNSGATEGNRDCIGRKRSHIRSRLIKPGAVIFYNIGVIGKRYETYIYLGRDVVIKRETVDRKTELGRFEGVNGV